jgi:hypothetical protein
MKLNFTLTTNTLLILAAVCLMNLETEAQKQIQVFGLGGYLINSDVTVAEGELSFNDNYTAGAGLAIEVEKNMFAEISWSMSASAAELERYTGYDLPPTNDIVTDVYIHHFQVGALVEPERNEKLSPFGLITVGSSLFHPTKENLEDEWRFSIALGGGLKIYLSDTAGLRFQGRLIIPMQFSGGSVWVGSGGAAVSVGSWTAFVEGEFSGGLFISL